MLSNKSCKRQPKKRVRRNSTHSCTMRSSKVSDTSYMNHRDSPDTTRAKNILRPAAQDTPKIAAPGEEAKPAQTARKSDNHTVVDAIASGKNTRGSPHAPYTRAPGRVRDSFPTAPPARRAADRTALPCARGRRGAADGDAFRVMAPPRRFRSGLFWPILRLSVVVFRFSSVVL